MKLFKSLEDITFDENSYYYPIISTVPGTGKKLRYAFKILIESTVHHCETKA